MVLDLTNFDPLRTTPPEYFNSASESLFERIADAELNIDGGWPIGLDNDLIMSPGSFLHRLCVNMKEQDEFHSFYCGPPLIRQTVHVEYSLWFLAEKAKEFSEEVMLEVARLNGVLPALADGPMRIAKPTVGDQVQFPNMDERSKRLRRLYRWMNEPDPYSGNPLFDAILVYTEFMVIHPLKDGNGRVARALFQHRLMTLGLLSYPLVPLGCIATWLRPQLFHFLRNWETSGNADRFLRMMVDYCCAIVPTIHQRYCINTNEER